MHAEPPSGGFFKGAGQAAEEGACHLINPLPGSAGAGRQPPPDVDFSNLHCWRGRKQSFHPWGGHAPLGTLAQSCACVRPCLATGGKTFPTCISWMHRLPNLVAALDGLLGLLQRNNGGFAGNGRLDHAGSHPHPRRPLGLKLMDDSYRPIADTHLQLACVGFGAFAADRSK